MKCELMLYEFFLLGIYVLFGRVLITQYIDRVSRAIYAIMLLKRKECIVDFVWRRIKLKIFFITKIQGIAGRFFPVPSLWLKK